MKKILSTLQQPYPYYNQVEQLPKNASYIFLIVFVFLFLFSPFHVNDAENKYSYSIICLIHAASSSLIYLIYFFAVNKLFNIKEENWKVYKAIGMIAACLFFIGLGSFFVRPLVYDNPHNFSWHYFVEETINTFLVGSLVFAGLTLIDMKRLLKTNRAGALGLDKELKEQKETDEMPQTIFIKVEDALYELPLNEFLFAKAEGNYTEFYFLRNNAIVKQLKRATLKSIEMQLPQNAVAIMRTHRAFLVNTKLIVKMTGNAQGYQLNFNQLDFAVPVSRACIPAFKLVMKSK